MSKVSLDEFIAMTTGEGREPMLSFYWLCLDLPGHDPRYVESISLPFPSISPKEGLFGAGKYSYYAGFLNVSAFDMVFYEDSKLSTVKWLRKWQERIRNPATGAFYLPTYYKENLLIELKNTKGESIAQVKLLNVWPTQMSNWDLTYTGGDRIKVQQNFSVDDVVFVF